MDNSDLASPSGTGPSPSVEPVPVSPVPASAPDAGDIVIIEHPYVYDRYIVARVEKVGKVMWEVSTWGRDEWSRPVRRKVSGWFHVVSACQPSKLAEQLRNANDRMMVARRQVNDQYIERVRKIAQGIAARSDETANAGSAGGKSPVPEGDAP